MNQKRLDGRLFDQIRPVTISYDVYGYADASVLLELGNTKVLACVTLQQGVPPFLKGQKVGWLSAEYAMLPSATHQRTIRESSQNQRNARSVEISRLIGRCLRPTVDLDSIGERTIVIDCEVLQADGGTRVASITAASLALKLAAKRWIASRVFEKDIVKEQIAAISTGIINDKAYTDLSYYEDSRADADFNFVLTQACELIEVQGTSEKKPVNWTLFDDLKGLAINSIKEIFQQINTFKFPSIDSRSSNQGSANQALFSLGNRLSK